MSGKRRSAHTKGKSRPGWAGFFADARCSGLALLRRRGIERAASSQHFGNRNIFPNVPRGQRVLTENRDVSTAF